MRFSLNWLRELCPAPDEPRRVADLLTARGLTVDALERADGDWVLDVDVPANRPDCLGHRGLARELAAGLGLGLRPESPALPAASTHPSLQVTIEAPDLCSRYSALILREVRVRPSPAAVSRRLEACGFRPINNVVDASNLVLLESGHPVHAFDLAAVRGARIRVRRAGPEERLCTLDGIERRLDPAMLVIADGERAIALAGMMGGAESEIRETTRDVLVEAAWFAPAAVRATSRGLGLSTEASQRFARGADRQGTPGAQALAAIRLGELAGGRPDGPVLDVCLEPHAPLRLQLRPEQLPRLLGYAPDPAEVEAALSALELSPRREADDALRVTVPSYRVDLEREADLVEEVARHLGYDRIPAVRTALAIDWQPDPATAVEDGARDLLAHLGFHETLGYAMIGPGEDDPFLADGSSRAALLANPLAESMSALRRSLLPGLLRTLDLNARRGVRDVRLFEIEHVFVPRARPEDPPHEPLHVGIAWAGAAQPRHWSAADRELDLYDMIGLVERLIEYLRPGTRLKRAVGGPVGFHPGRSVRWRGMAADIAWCGQLHPEIAARLELDHRPYLAALDLDQLAELPATQRAISAPPRLGAVVRDLAVVLSDGLGFERVLDVLVAVPAPAEALIEAVDRYAGPPLAPGETSLTVRITLQPAERALTDAEIESYRGALIEALAGQLGVSIRR